MNKTKATILRNPPHPPHGDWLPVDAVEAYFDLHQTVPVDAKRLLERMVVSDCAAPALIKLASRLNYLGWSLLFQTAIDAAFMPFGEMHGALSRANGLRDAIVAKASELATLLDEYQATCAEGKVCTGYDARGLGVGSAQAMEYQFREQLREMAARMTLVVHTRIGVGKPAWSSRVQSTTDGLPQFVRYFDDRLKTYVEDGGATGGLASLTPTQLARLAIPALNIGNHKDKDILSETMERIKGIRKKGDNSKQKLTTSCP